jgi:hypothetical protein
MPLKRWPRLRSDGCGTAHARAVRARDEHRCQIHRNPDLLDDVGLTSYAFYAFRSGKRA